MIRGIYIAASGMLAESARQDVVANNLANATTTGFKRSVATSSSFGDMLVRNMGMPGAPEVGPLNLGVQVEGLATIHSQGPLRSTGNSLDLALIGDGYFAIDGPNGRRYTRDGSFGLDAGGRLVTKDGSAVLGADGAPIVLGRGDVRIGADGTITQDDLARGRLMLTRLAPGSQAEEGGGVLNGTPAGPADARVRQSHLEGSAVNVVSEMVELIRVMRSFEANQKALQAHDEALQATVTRVGGAG